MFREQNIIYMAVITLNSVDAIAACRTVERNSRGVASVTMNCDWAFSSSSNRLTSSTANGGSSTTSIGTVNYFRTSIEAVNGFVESAR